MRARAKQPALFGKSFRKILMLFSWAAAAVCLALLLPQVRAGIIAFGENVIVHRRLTREVWQSRLFNRGAYYAVFFALAGVFMSGGEGGIIRDIVKKTLNYAGKHPLARYIFLALPVLYGFAIVFLFGVNVLTWDEGELVHFFKEVQAEGLSFAKLFAQHNEHRMFFPKIIFYILGTAAKFNSKSFMFVSFAFNVIRYCVFIIVIKQITKNTIYHIPLCLLVGLCVFSIVQSENILWGFQLAWFMLACFAVLSFYLFYLAYTKNSGLYYLLADVCALIACFSSLHGLFILPAMLCVLGLQALSAKKLRIKPLLFVMAPLALSFLFYFAGYHEPAHPSDYLGLSPVKMFFYFTAAAGSGSMPALPGIPDVFFAVIAGFALCLAGVFFVVYLLKKNNIKNNIFPLCLLFFGFAFCAAITAGRSGFGAGQALASRYTTFSLFIVTGLILLTVNTFDIKKNNYAFYSLLLVFFLTIAQNIYFSSVTGHALDQQENRSILADYKNQPLESLEKIYPWQTLQDAYADIQFLEQKGWSVFASNQKKGEGK